MNIRELFTAPDDKATLNEIHTCGDELIEKLLDGLDDNSEASSMGGVELNMIYKKLPRKPGALNVLFLYVTEKLHRDGILLVPVPIVEINRLSDHMQTSGLVLYGVRSHDNADEEAGV